MTELSYSGEISVSALLGGQGKKMGKGERERRKGKKGKGKRRGMQGRKEGRE